VPTGAGAFSWIMIMARMFWNGYPLLLNSKPKRTMVIEPKRAWFIRNAAGEGLIWWFLEVYLASAAAKQIHEVVKGVYSQMRQNVLCSIVQGIRE